MSAMNKFRIVNNEEVVICLAFAIESLMEKEGTLEFDDPIDLCIIRGKDAAIVSVCIDTEDHNRLFVEVGKLGDVEMDRFELNNTMVQEDVDGIMETIHDTIISKI